jgi:hypothetical protein
MIDFQKYISTIESFNLLRDILEYLQIYIKYLTW